MPPQDDFASKVIKSLQKNNQAVDLTSTDEVVEEITIQPEPVVEEPVVEPVAVPSSLGDVTAYGNPQVDGLSGIEGPVAGGNKDIIIVPGFAGAAATSVSQVNFYWRAPATVDITGFDANVRTTIFNYALSTGVGITTPVLVFGGYNGTTNYLPSRNWNNAGTGVTAKVWINPFRGDIAVDYLQLNAGSGGAGATTLQGSFYYDVAQDKLRFATSTSGTAGFAKTVAFTDDIVTATTVFVAAAAGSTVLYPTFSNISTSGSGVGLSVDADINFNPGLNVFTVPNVYSGTALSSVLFTSSAGVSIKPGANSTTGIQLDRFDGTPVINVDTTNSRVGINNVTAPAYALDVSGDTNISNGSVFRINTASILSSTVLGSSVTTSSLTSVGTITSGTWAGTAITTLYGGTGNLVPFAVGDLLVANSATTLTKLSDVATGSVLASGGVGVAPAYVATSTLSVGTANTSANIAVVDSATTNTNMYLLIGTPRTSTTGAGTAVSSNLNIFYNPSTNLLTTGGLAVTSSTALSSGTYLTVRTHPTDDNSTTDYFIRGLNSDNSTSKFSVDANGNLRATTKSFDIPHPTKPGKRLVYGVLEGPEHGVYHRGTVTGKSPLKIELPEYWDKLVGANYNVNLTTWGNYNVHIVEKNEKYFTIQLNGLHLITKFKEIKVDFVVQGSRIDAPLKVEQD